MKEQKFFTVTLKLPHSHLLGRNLIESWLQFFFESELRGKKLSEFIGNKTIHLIQIESNRSCSKWWERVYAVKKIESND